jgi:hypothetical protein
MTEPPGKRLVVVWNTITKFVPSQLSKAKGVSKTGIVLHGMALLGGQMASGGVVSTTVMV